MNILKTFAFTASAIALATTARAVDPVAVWSGFNELESGNFTADIGSLIPDATTGAVTLGSSGIKFANSGDAWSGANKGFTVAIKYSNFASGTAAALVTMQHNSETTAAGIDKLGAWVNASGNVQGVWNGSSYGTANGTLPASGIVFVRYKDSNGTSVHLQNGTLLYEAGGLKSSDNNWGKSFAVGSFANGTSNVASGLTIEAVAIFDSRLSDADMGAYEFPKPETVESLTVTLTNDNGSGTLGGVGNYQPDALLIPESAGIDEGKVVKVKSVTFALDSSTAASADWVSLNGVQSSSKTISGTWPNTAYPLVTYDFGDGVEVEIGKSAPMAASGDSRWRLFANVTDPDRMYIGVTHTQTMNNKYRPAYKIVVEVPVAQEAYTGKVISFNFAQMSANGQNPAGEIPAVTQTTVAGDIPQSAWSQGTSTSWLNVRDFSSFKVYNLKNPEADAVAISSMKASWDSPSTTNYGRGGADNTATPDSAYYYLDCWLAMKNTSASSNPTLSITTIPYEKYDLILYFNGSPDGNRTTNPCFSLNAVNYSVDAEGAPIANSTSGWGLRSQTTASLGVNAVKFENMTAEEISIGYTGAGGGIAAFQIVERTVTTKTAKAEISENSTWTELDWDVAPTASSKAELTVSANATLTFDETTAFKSLKLIGSADLTIDGITSANAGLIAKINVSSFTGKLRFEIDASAGLTADAALKNYIRAASGKVTFVFKSTAQNQGVTIDYGDSNDGTQLATHIIFEGGAHSMKYRCENAGLKFGANATAENPTLRITNNATLTFAARNLCGWTSGNADANGIIRVDNGSKLNLNPTGGTLYWAQQFYLEPGAQLTYSDGASFRINGGTGFAPQIFVPDSYEDMTATPAKIIRSGNNDFCVNGQGTKGMAISVGTNTKLIIEGGIALDNANCDVVKLGGGVLAVTGNIVNQNFIVDDGSVSLSGSITKLTFNANGVLNLDNGAPTITGELSTFTSKRLDLTVAEPEHLMPVITLPEAADKTGWTAVVNGNTANPCDLVADGNTLKLKWKVPPTITVDADDVTIETADDWNGGVVTVDLGGLKVGDYEGYIYYFLRFGDKVVTGSANDTSVSFNLDPSDFTAGNIYRGTFELEYGEGNPAIVAAEVTVYAGKKKYDTKEGWINETKTTFKSTGTYNPESGAMVSGDLIKFLNSSDVVFTPTNSPADYVAKCDSEVTFEIFSGEEAIQDDDDTVADGLQAGVKIIDNENGGVKFQFISGDAWIDGPAATLNTTYEVTVKFHYAKEDGDTDIVTYEVKDLTQSPVVSNRRANTAEKLETIAFADGTQIASLIGTCQIEVADPVEKEKGMAPGAGEKELKATDETAAQTEAEKIPIVVPSDVAAGLADGADEATVNAAKEGYKTNFKVVAQKNASGKFVAIVVPTVDAEKKAEDEVQKVSSEVLTKVTALTGDQTEGTATVEQAVPGFFYGVAENGEVVEMKTAEPEEWKMAGASGKVELKVTKPTNAKSRFYKILCSPLPKK